tara:strand:+ start:169 stop:540 length:372 start_codon:yes stop_codon:yes gene_type:complete
MDNESDKFLAFKKEDIEGMLVETGEYVDRVMTMLTTCLLKEGGFRHPKYEYLIELLCEGFSINNKLKHLLEKALEYSSSETKNGAETIYVDSQSAFVLETIVMAKLLNSGDLNKEVNLSMSIH